MDGNTKLNDLTVDEYKVIGLEMIQDVSVNHFLKAADDLFWKNTKTLGVELMGKDITSVDDVRCIRKTFDESQKCRIKKEKQEDAFISEKAKRKVMMIFLIIPILISLFALLN